MTSAKPTELRICTPEAFDGSYKNAVQWLNTVQFYLHVNDKVYDTDAKQVVFALSYMTKGPALTWANTFRQKAISGATVTLGTFANFVSEFKKTFEHHDTVNDAVAWLATKRMVLNAKTKHHEPSLDSYISSFQNRVALAGITNENVLINYFSAGIPPSLMRRVLSMDTPPTTVADWYKKATHFQKQWDRADEIARRSRTSSSHFHSFTTPTPAKDPDAMDVDVVRISKLTPDERKRCIEKGLCFRCRRAGHNSTSCPSFPSTPNRRTEKKVHRVEEESDLPTLQEIDDEDEVAVRKVSFQMDF